MVLRQHALTEVAVIETEAGIATGTQTTVIERVIHAVSAAMNKEAGRLFHYAAGVVERVPGFGSFRLEVSRRPLRSISEIALLAQNGSVSSTYTASDYEIEQADYGWIYKETGWPDTSARFGGFTGKPIGGTERSSLRITYTGGWITPFQATAPGGSLGTRDLPEDLEEACIVSVTSLLKRRGHDLLVNTQGDESENVSYNYRKGLLLPETLAVAHSYGRGWFGG